jgi:hypothetical protein
MAGKPEGSRQLGRLRRRCETNIKINLTEMGRGGEGRRILDKCGSR